MSFVADAGQDPVIGATRATLSAVGLGQPGVLVPAMDIFDAGVRDSLQSLARDGIVREARLNVGSRPDLDATPDETDPRIVVKADHGSVPEVNRAPKGDPSIGLRPTFEIGLRRRGALPDYVRAAVVFADGDDGAPPHELIPPGDAPPGPDSVAHFMPLPDGVALTTRQSFAAASPSAGGTGTTQPSHQDGSSPAVTRASVLASSTPVEAGSTPIQIAPLPKFSRGTNGVLASGTTVVMGVVEPTPTYAALLSGENAAAEQHCLAEAVYFEARSEPEEGQAAVAQVVLNRAMSGLYPASICGVVFQNQQRRNACQFSFACEGHALHVTEPAAWSRAARVAREVLEGAAYVSDIGDATHYHANYVRPRWARRLVRADKIGNHIFYKLRPGQT
ncbi:cell wall hydrolase [Lichenihabitans sp. Uapishka_5]|uniref:cell wall hydrolase n=1 Tax=Lichenihabitans sp. Uapishka_5 TaxID=3037302 RepID=UPI0029E7FE60|nr:cell wall hydrolase [Lichenihabitans sp. Uapishka_5]MDX7949696.1 cell wall hydrolase [Lichenihabitans sp. Uapishka_5]